MKRLYILSILTLCSSLAAMEPVCGKRTADDGTEPAAKRIHQDQKGADESSPVQFITTPPRDVQRPEATRPSLREFASQIPLQAPETPQRINQAHAFMGYPHTLVKRFASDHLFCQQYLAFKKTTALSYQEFLTKSFLLYSSIYNQEWELSKYLVEHGFSLNKYILYDADGSLLLTPLAFLLIYNKFPISFLEWVLDHGAIVNNIAMKKVLPAPRTFSIIPKLHNSAPATPLELAVQHCNDDVVMLLIQHGASITFKALMHAVNKGKPSTIKLLLDHGAAALVNDNENADEGTPLHYADTVEVADLLVQAGAQVDVKNVRGETPLHRVIKNLKAYSNAEFNNDTKLINYYLDHGASINNCTYLSGQTPLYTLLDRMGSYLGCIIDGSWLERCINILTLLLERGASLTRTHARTTHDPIHHVFLCYLCDTMKPSEVLAILRCLVEHGADITTQDSEHRTVLTLAKKYIKRSLESNLPEYNQKHELEKKWQTVIDYIVQEQQKQEQCKAEEKTRRLAQLATDPATRCAICLEQITAVQENQRDCTNCCSQFICVPCKERWMLEQHQARREPTCPLCRRQLT